MDSEAASTNKGRSIARPQSLSLPKPHPTERKPSVLLARKIAAKAPGTNISAFAAQLSVICSSRKHVTAAIVVSSTAAEYKRRAFRSEFIVLYQHLCGLKYALSLCFY